MNKSERQQVALMANAFSELTFHIIKFDEEMQLPNPNIEQVEAHFQDILTYRNMMTVGFVNLEPSILKGFIEQKKAASKIKKMMHK